MFETDLSSCCDRMVYGQTVGGIQEWKQKDWLGGRQSQTKVAEVKMMRSQEAVSFTIDCTPAFYFLPSAE